MTNTPISKEEVKEMIDTAIRRHNRNAGMISMFVGFFVLGLFSEGLLRLIGVIPPLLPWTYKSTYSRMDWYCPCNSVWYHYVLSRTLYSTW